MAWPADVAAQPDNAGGILVIGYNVGARLHQIRTHIQQFTLSSLHDTAGNPDYNYSDSESFLGITFSTTELSIQDTAVALIGKLKPYYPSSTAFYIAALYQLVSGVANEVFPAAALGAEAGTGSPTGSPVIPAMTADDPQNFVASNFVMRTRGGGRSRMRLAGAAARNMQSRAAVTGTGGGLALPTGTDALDQALAGYLTDSRTRITGRDGYQLAGPVRVHAAPLARFRRNNSLA